MPHEPRAVGRPLPDRRQIATDPAPIAPDPARLLTDLARLAPDPAQLARNPAQPVRNRAPLLRKRARLLRNRALLLRNRAWLLRNHAPLLRNPAPLVRNHAPVLRRRARLLRKPARLLREPASLLRNPGPPARNLDRSLSKHDKEEIPMPADRSFPGFMADWDRLIKAVANNQQALPDLAEIVARLEELLAEARSLDAGKAALRAQLRSGAKRTRILIPEGRAAASRVRAALVAHYGKHDERLGEFGIAPVRRRRVPERPDPAPPSPPIEVPRKPE